MLRRLFKPYCLLLYLLSILVFFFIGVTYAGLVEAGKGQMLAGGAIVLGYGVLGSSIGLVSALITASKLDRKKIIRINLSLAILLLIFWAYYAYKYRLRQDERDKQIFNIEAINDQEHSLNVFKFQIRCIEKY